MCTSYCYATVICLYLDHFHLYRGCSFRCSSSCCCCWNDTSGCCDVRSRRFLNFTRICRKVTWVQNIYVICISDAVNASKSVLHPLVRQRHSSSKLHSGSDTPQPHFFQMESLIYYPRVYSQIKKSNSRFPGLS